LCFNASNSAQHHHFFQSGSVNSASPQQFIPEINCLPPHTSMITSRSSALAAMLSGCTFLLSASTATASNIFSHNEISPDRVVAVAAPYGEGSHQLLVIQQVTNDRLCWNELGNQPTRINPLLSDFDFTGICGRSLDSNGYSIRLANQDLDWRYSLRIVNRNGDLTLVGVSSTNRNAPELAIGHVGGSLDGFAKIQLNPGWRMTQRTYQGDPLGHIYFTNDQSLTALSAPPAKVGAQQGQSPVVQSKSEASRAAAISTSSDR
jgi:hypothetical protein